MSCGLEEGRPRVGSIGKELAQLLTTLPTDEKTLIARRAAKVRTMWKDAVEYVYKENAPYVLEHVNAVYIKEEDGVRSLYVYMDDGNFRADVHCRQHLIMLRLHERFGERIDVFKTYPSRFDMRKRHPYRDELKGEAKPMRSVPLSPEERADVARTVATVEDLQVRRALEKAMAADKEWKKGETE